MGIPLRVTSYSESLFTALVQAQAVPGEEIRLDDVAGGDLYHGRAADGSATSTAAWEVIRFYRDASGRILRIRYRSDVVWDSRTAGWT